MMENGHAHFLTQRARQLNDLSDVPEAKRAEHFLLQRLDPAVRSARFAMGLKIADEKVVDDIKKVENRLVRLRDALADLQSVGNVETRSRAVAFRGGAKTISALLGR